MSKLFLYSRSPPSTSAATLWNYPYSMLLECALLLFIEPIEDPPITSSAYTSPLDCSLSDCLASPFLPFLAFWICSVTNIGCSSS